MNWTEALGPLGDEIHLIVLGPGMGECVLLYWPPDHWMAIDSFQRAADPGPLHPAVEILSAFEAKLDAVVLTHPHEDHTSGLPLLIDQRKTGGLVGWWPAAIGANFASSHPGVAARQGANEHAVAAIDRAWKTETASKWEMSATASAVSIGDVEITVLSPLEETAALVKKTARPNMNRLSTALLVTWHDCKLVLGGDLVNSGGWDPLAKGHGAEAFADSQGLKVAHHGSLEAQHSVAIGQPPPSDRVFLASPYSRGKKVPDFSPGGGVEHLLTVAEKLRVSTHHGSRPVDAGTVDYQRMTFEQAGLPLGPLTLQLDADRAPVRDCWVAARWAPNGTLGGVRRGAGSISVVS